MLKQRVPGVTLILCHEIKKIKKGENKPKKKVKQTKEKGVKDREKKQPKQEDMFLPSSHQS